MRETVTTAQFIKATKPSSSVCDKNSSEGSCSIRDLVPYKQQDQGGLENICITNIDPALLLHPVPKPSETDVSLEKLFGPGATKLALEMESMGGVCAVQGEGGKVSDGESPLVEARTPSRDVHSNKRLRGENISNFGAVSSAVGDDGKNEGFEDGVSKVESKKPKIGENDSILNEERLDHVRDPESYQDLADF